MHMWENGWQAKLALYQVPRQNERISRFVSKVQAQKCLRDCLVPATAGCVVVRLKDRAQESQYINLGGSVLRSKLI